MCEPTTSPTLQLLVRATRMRDERKGGIQKVGVKLKELLSCATKALTRRRRVASCWLLIVTIVAASSSLVKLASALAFTQEPQTEQQDPSSHVKNFKHQQATSYSHNERLKFIEPDESRPQLRAQRHPASHQFHSNGATSSDERETEQPNKHHSPPLAAHHSRTQPTQTHPPPARLKRRHKHEERDSGTSSFFQTSNWSGNSQMAADRPLVATQKGLVRGITQKVATGKFVDAFLGIPFAQPPLGSYRFRHPQPAQAWSGELDASKMPNSCYQVNDTFFGAQFLGTSIWNANTPLSEDCLYLNIWTPFGVANTSLATPTRSGNTDNSGGSEQRSLSKRPVLVWIFGGGFYSGTSSLAIYEGGVLASEEEVIVVSMNYRVSALGFLYFARPDSPGNAGMFDQLMALQWVSDNIHQFGGDPDRVTIFGESAGAVSVAFHLLSPLSRNLFSQAILQSGAATCPWGYKEPREIMENGLQLATLLNCPTNQSNLDLVLECLLRAKPMDLVSKEVGHTRAILNFPFVPVVDGSFLIEPPVESLSKANFKQAPILLGSNYDEGNSFLIYLPQFNTCPSDNGKDSESSSQASDQQQPANLQATSGGEQSMSLIAPSVGESIDQRATLDPFLLSSTNRTHSVNQPDSDNSRACRPNEFLSLSRDDFLSVLRDGLNPFADHQIGKEAIVFEYSNWNNPQDSISNYDALDKIAGDYYFTCHVNEFAQQYANNGNQVYMYYFKQRSTMSPWPKWMGVLHADEINFVFGEPLNQLLNYTAKEVELSRRMMKYWANFAKFGNPAKTSEKNSSNSSPSGVEVKWPEYADKRQYFELHSDFIRIGRGPRAKQCAFWFHYLPKLTESFDRLGQCPAASGSGQSSVGQSMESSLAPDSSTWIRRYGSTNQKTNLLSLNSSHKLHHSQHFLSNVPSALLIGLIVIFVLIIISLLVYAKRKWKLDFGLGSGGHARSDNNTHERWRNQRAAASMNREQQAAAAHQSNNNNNNPTSATPSQTNAAKPTAVVNNSTSTFGSTPTEYTTTTTTTTSNAQPAAGMRIPAGQAKPTANLQLHNMRPKFAGTTGSGVAADQAPANNPSEQSAFADMAQSAAARVSGSAAAAMAAAAKFKMLRSNTLAAAFGARTEASGDEVEVGEVVVAVRKKDERVVSSLASNSRGARPLNLDARQ